MSLSAEKLFSVMNCRLRQTALAIGLMRSRSAGGWFGLIQMCCGMVPISLAALSSLSNVQRAEGEEVGRKTMVDLRPRA